MTDVQLKKDHIRLLDDELPLHPSNEACGVFIGRKEKSSIIVEIVLPIKNSRPSYRSFELDSMEHYEAWNRADEGGMEIVGCTIPILIQKQVLQRGIGKVWKTTRPCGSLSVLTG